MSLLDRVPSAPPNDSDNAHDMQQSTPSVLSRFELLLANNPPVLDSLVAQLPTQSILDLYHTSPFLNRLLRNPGAWRYMSFRKEVNAVPTNPVQQGHRQAGNYALDQLLFNLVIPFSTRLTSLVLDNTSVSGATLFSAVMVLRKYTIEHVSVRGCKNVSLKYHINPWLAMHAMAAQQPAHLRSPEFQKLALKYLYTYRCRHHRRRPYLPASLNRKESDSEPTHELVLTCHTLGIWTDTAWCTTPGARCYRRRGYVNMRAQQDPREVWVVFDRLWRSRNWLGEIAGRENANPITRKRKRDGRFWEQDEDGIHGEPIGLSAEGKHVPAHLRESHTKFVNNIQCDECAAPISERCEQCSVMMHCSGCRKTLCASCSFDRPYLRNSMASEEAKQRFWWAPGAAVSPCCMQDTDLAPNGGPNQPNPLPNITFKWCCTEPVFSGGGGITLAGAQTQDADRLRAAPLPAGQGFEDSEFAAHHIEDCHELGSPLSRATVDGPGGRWASLSDMFKYGVQINTNEETDSIPRILCNDCHSSEQWKLKCKSCSVALCLRHDVKEKQRVRICGYRDLNIEKQELLAKLKASKLFKSLWMKKKAQENKSVTGVAPNLRTEAEKIMDEAQLAVAGNLLLEEGPSDHEQLAKVNSPHLFPLDAATTLSLALRVLERPAPVEPEPIARPLSPGSNSTGTLSREPSPAPSARSVGAASDSHRSGQQQKEVLVTPVAWKGCQSFFCPAIRPTGDHRRRCSAIMRQCRDCKVYVCDDCVSDLDKPCPCQGCRLPAGESDPISGSTSSFFCPNCRHGRIISRKCRKNVSCLGKGKMAMLQKERRTKNKMTPQEKIGHIANILLDTSTFGSTDDFTLENFYDSVNQELQELQEISMSAVSVVRKVQNLRSQAMPGSPAALALPNIIIEGVDDIEVSSSA